MGVRARHRCRLDCRRPGRTNAFAATFYGGMLGSAKHSGKPCIAREGILAAPRCEYLGAYQCYGDPVPLSSRQQRRRAITRHPSPPPTSWSPSSTTRPPTCGQRHRRCRRQDPKRRLGRIPASRRTPGWPRAEVQAALAHLGEARRWPEAIACLEAALTADKGDCAMKALEQYIFRVRFAAEL